MIVNGRLDPALLIGCEIGPLDAALGLACEECVHGSGVTVMSDFD